MVKISEANVCMYAYIYMTAAFLLNLTNASPFAGNVSREKQFVILNTNLTDN